MKKVLTIMLLYSTLIFSQWELRYPDIPSDFINDICFVDENIGFIVNDGGSILKTSDGGETWRIIKHYQRNSLTEIKFIDQKYGFALSPHSFIGDDLNFIYTTDGGINWERSNIYLSDAVSFLPLSKSELLSATSYQGTIERLDNFFGNWEIVFTLPSFIDYDVTSPYGHILQFQKFDNKILALGASINAKRAGILTDSISFILKSIDNGLTWDTLWCDLSDVANTFYFINDSVGWMGLEYNEIYKSIDGGKTWHKRYSDSTNETNIKSIYAVNSNVYAIDGSGKIIFSKNDGDNWQTYKLDGAYDYSYKIRFLNENKGFVIGRDFWKTTNGGASWSRISKSLKGDIRKIYFASENKGIGVGEGFVYGTNDGGYSWEVLLNNGDYFSGLDMIDSLNIWVVGYDSLYKSIDGGNSWTSIKLSNNIQLMRGITFLNKNVGVVFEVWENDTTYNYVTTNGGVTWKRYTVNGLQFVNSFSKMKFTDPKHLWFANQSGVWLSKDTAKSWKLYEIEDAFYSFDFIDSLYGCETLWGGRFDKVAFTSDGGNSWEIKDKPYSAQPEDVFIYKEYGLLQTFIAGYEGSLLEFKQYDDFVYSRDTYTGNPLFSFASFKNGNNLHIWVAGAGMTVLHYQTVVTNIREKLISNNNSFSLSQNYPNPFNPSTTISYQIPKAGLVTLKVYNILGREVAELVNKQQAAGSYKVNFDASNLPAGRQGLSSGVYIYRLQAGSFISTKKFILLK